MKEIFQGAEAKIYLLEGKETDGEFLFEINKHDLEKILNDTVNKDISFKYKKRFVILKARYRKKYRNLDIDKEFRKYRTRREVSIIHRLTNFINVPEIIFFDEDLGIIFMEYIGGYKLSDVLENLNYKNLLYEIGKQVGIIHKNKIVHGDLTTSNILLEDQKLYFIDFGLSFFSNRIEDFAVDIHLFKESFESRHWKIIDSFENFLDGYKESNPDANIIFRRLEDIEKRGRYKKVI